MPDKEIHPYPAQTAEAAKDDKEETEPPAAGKKITGEDKKPEESKGAKPGDKKVALETKTETKKTGTKSKEEEKDKPRNKT